jgi:hypothetical protein
MRGEGTEDSVGTGLSIKWLFQDGSTIKGILRLRSPRHKNTVGVAALRKTGSLGSIERRFQLPGRLESYITPQVYIVIVSWRVEHNSEFKDEKRP